MGKICGVYLHYTIIHRELSVYGGLYPPSRKHPNVKTGTITEKILRRASAQLKDDTENGRPSKTRVILEQSEESYTGCARSNENTPVVQRALLRKRSFFAL